MALLVNARARHDYQIEATWQAGMVLSGPEVKSLRLRHGSLTGSFVKLVGDELFLVGAQINPYAYADNSEYDPKRTRKLLLKRKEIEKLRGQLEQKGRSLVPLSIFLAHNRLKLEIGLGIGKKQHEKREQLRRRAQKRQLDKEFKTKLRGF